MVNKKAATFWYFLKDLDSSKDRTEEKINQAHERAIDLLQRYDDGLGLEFSRNTPNSIEIIITAYGNPDHRKSLLNLISERPEFNNLKVTAFRPKQGDFEIEIEGHRFSGSDIFFDPLEKNHDPCFIGIDIYFIDHKNSADDLLMTVAGLAIQATIGEREFMDKINLIRLGSRDANPEDFVPLEMLSRLIEMRESRLRK